MFVSCGCIGREAFWTIPSNRSAHWASGIQIVEPLRAGMLGLPSNLGPQRFSEFFGPNNFWIFSKIGLKTNFKPIKTSRKPCKTEFFECSFGSPSGRPEISNIWGFHAHISFGMKSRFFRKLVLIGSWFGFGPIWTPKPFSAWKTV